MARPARFAPPDRRTVAEWVQEGIITPTQADDILRRGQTAQRHSKVAPPPSRWTDAATSLGAMALATVAVVLLSMPFLQQENNPFLLSTIFALGLTAALLAVFLRSWDERASELGFGAAMAAWACLAFFDQRHTVWTALPLLAATWGLLFVAVRPETRLCAAVMHWPATVFLLQGFDAEGLVLSGTEVQFAVGALYLLLLGLALPRHGPWRQVPRAVLVALGLVVSLASLFAFVGGPSLRTGVGFLLGAAGAAGAAWLLRPDRAILGDRFPRFELPLVRPF